MILRIPLILLRVSLLSSTLVSSLSSSEIPSDTPLASLIASAKASLASGKAHDALIYYDAAISRDPHSYLTIFQRGAAHLSLGNNGKALQDFDKALSIRPDFEGALLQRAKIKSRGADWEAAKDDYRRANKGDSPEYAQLEEAAGAATLALDAERTLDWESCVGHAGTAILVASKALQLRQTRAHCRLERGEVLEALSDLQHVIQISPSHIEPHLQISSMFFYSVNEREKALEQMKKCLRSDPDSKPCSKLFRREKQLNKALAQVNKFLDKRQYNSAVKLLIPQGEDVGLIKEVEAEVANSIQQGYVHKNSPNELYNSLVEKACELYLDMNNRKKATPFCKDALAHDPNSLNGLILRAQEQLDAEEIEPAIGTLNTASEHHPSASERIQPLLQKAHTLLKRSKTKDYYKILGVATDADELAIKRAYRRMTKQHHPDKAITQGVSREQAQKKMAEINEAYEVLSDAELRARFDRGDDPNNPEQQQGGPFHGSPFGQGAGGQQQFFFRQGAGGGGGGGGGGGAQFKFQGGGFQFPGF